MKIRTTALLATLALAAPVAAGAQPVTGLYVGAGAGVNWLQSTNQSQDVTIGAIRFGGDFKATFEPGFEASSASGGASATGSAPRSRATSAGTRSMS